MVHCVTHFALPVGTALIHSNDTDVFVLFVSLLQDLPCQKIIMKWSNDMFIDLTKINVELHRRSSELIGLHSFTGNDVVEKFSGKSKRTWVNAYLKADDKIVEAFTLIIP